MRLSNLQKSVALDHDSAHHSDVDGMKKLVLQKRNEYDTQKSAVLKLSSKLKSLKDEAKICRLEEQRPSQEEGGPLARQIQSLENRLDKAMIQYNEAYGICSTYEHIVKRLKEERVAFENQLTALERTLESKHRDFEELVLLSGDAGHAREIAQQNLQKSKWALEDNKARRSRDIRDRQQHVKIRKQMIKKHERSDEERRRAALGTADVDTSADDSEMASIPIGGRSAQQQIADQEHALNVYETAFRKIKDATGVSNVNEVIRKVVGQGATTDNLSVLTTQNQAKMEDLTRLQESLIQEVEKMKYSGAAASGGGGSSKSTKAIDEQQELLYLRSSQFERTKSQFDRLAFVMVSIKAGVEHLRDKFTSLPSDEFDVDHGVVVEDTLPEAIRSSGDLLVDVHTKTNDDELQLCLDQQDSKLSELKQQTSKLQSRRPCTAGASENRPGFRITLPSAKDVGAYNSCDSDSDSSTYSRDVDDVEISRGGVKKSSWQLLSRKEEEERKQRLLQSASSNQ